MSNSTTIMSEDKTEEVVKVVEVQEEEKVEVEVEEIVDEEIVDEEIVDEEVIDLQKKATNYDGTETQKDEVVKEVVNTVKNNNNSKNDIKELELEINERQVSHEKLRSYEVCRRTSYESKLNSSNLYWKSFHELMGSSVKETERAVILIRARVLADEKYGAHMQAIYDNLLESDGRPIKDDKRKKRIVGARERENAGDFKMKDAATQARR